jgi:hypothetical protein
MCGLSEPRGELSNVSKLSQTDGNNAMSGRLTMAMDKCQRCGKC